MFRGVDMSEFFATVTENGVSRDVVANFSSPTLASVSGMEGYVTTSYTYDLTFNFAGDGRSSMLLRGFLLVSNDSVLDAVNIFVSKLDTTLDLRLTSLLDTLVDSVGYDLTKFGYGVKHSSDLVVADFKELVTVTITVSLHNSVVPLLDIEQVVSSSVDYALRKFLFSTYEVLVG